MKTIKIIGAEWGLVASPKREENEERTYENWKGSDLPQICGCCGKAIKNIDSAKSLRIIDGGRYFLIDEKTDKDGFVWLCYAKKAVNGVFARNYWHK